MFQYTLGSLPDVLLEMLEGGFRDISKRWHFIQDRQEGLCGEFYQLHYGFGWHVDIQGKALPPSSGKGIFYR